VRRVFTCSHHGCGKTYTLKSNCTRHEREHIHQALHRCEICAKVFSSSSNLKAHKETHLPLESRRQFECRFPSCTKIYKYQSKFTKHLVKAHGLKSLDKKTTQNELLFGGNAKSAPQNESAETCYGHENESRPSDLSNEQVRGPQATIKKRISKKCEGLRSLTC
jgi:uncharacterized C2H2 Zn-finger protein